MSMAFHHRLFEHRETGPRLPGQRVHRRRYRAAELRRGLDEQGRFIGKGDVARGLAFFMHSRHSAP